MNPITKALLADAKTWDLDDIDLGRSLALAAWRDAGCPDADEPSRDGVCYVGTHEGLSGVVVRTIDGNVTRNDRLDPATHIATYSTYGFAWGFGGGGANQLALAILNHAGMLSTDMNVDCAPVFRRQVIERLETRKPWTIRMSDVVDWCYATYDDAEVIAAHILGYAQVKS